MKTSVAKKRFESKRDVAATVSEKLAIGAKILRKLRKQAMRSGSKRVRGVAEMMARCLDSQNVILAKNLKNQRGEKFDGYGTLYHCRQRVCPFCCSDTRRKSRAKAGAGLEATLPFANKEVHNRLVTLTYPTVPGLDPKESTEVWQRVWRKFSRTPFWTSRVFGAIKGIEFEPNKIGSHVHGHIIVFSEFIPENSYWEKRMCAYSEKRELASGNLQEVWTDCVKAVFRQLNLDVKIKTSNELFSVDVKDVREKGSREIPEYSSIEIGKALNEVSKYVTKNTSWLELDGDALESAVSVTRWPRMFEVTGVFNVPETSEAETVETDDDDTTSLDTIDDRSFDENRPDSLEAPSKTRYTSHSCQKSENVKRVALLSRVSSMPWDDWIVELDKLVWRAREFRRQQLKGTFPEASFLTLDGRFFGVSEDYGVQVGIETARSAPLLLIGSKKKPNVRFKSRAMC